MCEFDHKNDGRRIDPCMKNLIEVLRTRGVRTVACCCGHRVYPMTIVILQGFSNDTYALEIMSDKFIKRKKKFYKKDKKGFYYIPEVPGFHIPEEESEDSEI